MSVQVFKRVSQLAVATAVAASDLLAVEIDGVLKQAEVGLITGAQRFRVPEPTTDYVANADAVQALVDAASAFGGGTVYFSTGTYLTGKRIKLKSNVTIDCDPGAAIKLADGTADFCLTIDVGVTNVKILNIEVDGNKAGCPSGASGIQSEDATSSRVLIRNVYVHDCKLYGIRLSGTIVKVTECDVTDCDAAGITGDLLTYFGFTNNYSARNLHHGIGCIGVCSYGLITDNTAEDNGAPSIGADNLTGYGAALSHIIWDSNVTRRGMNNGVHVGGSHITFTNNIIENANFYGLIARNNDLSPMPGFFAQGNIIRGSGSNAGNGGVWLGNLVDFVWGANIVTDSYAHGLLVQEGCTKGSITGGVYSNNGGGDASGSGIRLQSGCSKITISAAQMANNASSGLRLADSTDILVTGCQAPDNPAPFVTTGATTCRVMVNDFPGVPSIVAGTVSYWADTPNGGPVNLASASPLVLSDFTDYFRVTGAVNFSAIGASWVGRRITLRFTGALTVTGSATLILNGGTYTAADNSTLTLVSDGTNWFETGRMTP